MRVLMFGWEYPPHVAGGLATATVGLVKGLLACGTEVTLVVPFPGADADDGGGLRIVSAPRLLAVHRVASPLEPYGDAAAYDEVLDGLERARPGATALYGRKYMCTKWFADGDVHAYFNPYETPYDAFVSFMNAAQDLEQRAADAAGARTAAPAA